MLALTVSSLICAVAFPYVSLAGYMPRLLVRLFSRGPVHGKEDMR